MQVVTITLEQGRVELSNLMDLGGVQVVIMIHLLMFYKPAFKSGFNKGDDIIKAEATNKRHKNDYSVIEIRKVAPDSVEALAIMNA